MSDRGGDARMSGRRVCAVDGCARPVKARGYCGMHYQRLAKHGAPEITMAAPWRLRPIRESLEMRMVDVPSGCREWIGTRTRQGYGRLTYKGRNTPAHRLTYEVFVGPIPAGMLICHRCDNPPCCNPDHLFVGTYADNNRDTVTKGRHRSAQRRLSDEHVVEIRRQYRLGQPITDIASAFGITRSYVSMLGLERTRVNV